MSGSSITVAPRSASWLWLGFLTAALLPACSTDGVVPAGLRDRGTVASLDYVVEERLPAAEASLVLLAPRLGDPALLGPDATGLEATLWLRSPEDATGLVAYSADARWGAPPWRELPADAEALPFAAAPRCDPRGLCRLQLLLPSVSARATAPGRPHGLCVQGSGETACAPAAWQRYPQIPAPLRLAALSDLHVGERAALARTRSLLEALAFADPPPDLIALTGDLTDTGDASLLQDLLGAVAGGATVPVIALPGNHDYKQAHIDTFLEQLTPRLNHAHVLGPYLVAALDTGPGRWDQEHRGTNGQTTGLETAQVEWLRATFEAHPEASARIVLLHAPPYSAVGSVFVRHRHAFMTLCRAQHVSLLVAGHIHRLESFDYAGVAQGLSVWQERAVPRRRMPVTVVSARSTDRTAGGYRWITLSPDGSASYTWQQPAHEGSP